MKKLKSIVYSITDTYNKHIGQKIYDMSHVEDVLKECVTNNTDFSKWLCSNIWYGAYIYYDNADDYDKQISDFYQFNDNGTLIYHNSPDGDILYGKWVVRDDYLYVYYINGDIGCTHWQMTYGVDTNWDLRVLEFNYTEPRHNKAHWIYTNVPVEELEL